MDRNIRYEQISIPTRHSRKRNKHQKTNISCVVPYSRQSGYFQFSENKSIIDMKKNEKPIVGQPLYTVDGQTIETYMVLDEQIDNYSRTSYEHDGKNWIPVVETFQRKTWTVEKLSNNKTGTVWDGTLSNWFLDTYQVEKHLAKSMKAMIQRRQKAIEKCQNEIIQYQTVINNINP